MSTPTGIIKYIIITLINLFVGILRTCIKKKKKLNVYTYLWEDFRLSPQSGIVLFENGIKP